MLPCSALLTLGPPLPVGTSPLWYVALMVCVGVALKSGRWPLVLAPTDGRNDTEGAIGAAPVVTTACTAEK